MKRITPPAFFLSVLTALAILGAFPAPGRAAGPRGGEPALIASWKVHEKLAAESPFRCLQWRTVGPKFQGGRIETLALDPENSAVFYAGAGSGGLWKTADGGVTWIPLFDGESTISMGDIVAAPSDPKILWVGTGENLRAGGYAFAGTGVFRSGDGGRTWRDTGLFDSHHIGRIVVHPKNPDVVYVAVIGHFFTENAERGLYKTTDGGRTWKRCLFASEKAGVVDVAMDPSDPETLYAASWQCLNGKGSGLYKTMDGGATWVRLAGGFPSGPFVGRIGVAVAPSDPKRVYAVVDDRTPLVKEGKEKGKGKGGEKGKGPHGHGRVRGLTVYSSRDGGLTWRRTQGSPLHPANNVGWAFGDIRVSPDDAGEIYLLGVRLFHSLDGGKSFERLGGPVIHSHPSPAITLHLDQHDLEIDPRRPDRLILGNDGGVYVSENRGRTWRHLNNLPIAEFYAIAADRLRPYRVYGGTQDNASLFGPVCRPLRDGRDDGWRYVWLDPWSGGDGFVTIPDPAKPGVVYYESQNGGLVRKNLRLGRGEPIKPRPPKGKGGLRTDWLTPYLVSRHNPLTLYYGANRLFKSLDRGETWRCISPDLTVRKDGKRKSRALSALAESPREPGLIYGGTEKGIVQVTGNDGVTWRDVSEGLPALHVKCLEASRYARDRVYAALTGIDKDDFTPYLFVSDDMGKSWRSIAANLPAECANVIREDPVEPEILYAGTDKGVYVSLDQGGSWLSLCGGLPPASVQDLLVHPRERELVIATHGRGIFVLDARPIEEYAKAKAAKKAACLFEIPPARLPQPKDFPGDYDWDSTGKAVFTYLLNGPKKELALSILDAKGRLVKKLPAPGKEGLNRVDWDLVVKGREEKGLFFVPGGNLVAPGTYTVRLEGEGVAETGELRVEPAAPSF